MGVFSFKELNDLKRIEVYDFIKEANELFHKSFEEMKKFYLSEVFNFGDNLFVSFDENQIAGTIGVITKEIPIKGEAFITEIFLNKDFLDSSLKVYGEHIVNELLQRAISICEHHNATKITLGLKNKLNFLEGYIMNNEFIKTHEAIIMEYVNKEDEASHRAHKNYGEFESIDSEETRLKHQYGGVETHTKLDDKVDLKVDNELDIELVPLSEENLQEFMIFHNEGFKETPNAANLSINETREFLHQYIGIEELIGLVKYDNKSIGIYMVAIDDNTGWIDNITILKEFRGSGLGKALVNKCINLLRNKGINNIKLLVMSSNTVAYNFYKNYGFVEDQIYSTWYEKR